ncbi:MAG: ParB/RepB/Spo0J family partition protein [Lachnospiraceae bacterium]|nr:ParB/RepB/Spo0J family partition protein [Lachnospiraceae bacterium]
MAKHTGLGKGLDSLISTKYTRAAGSEKAPTTAKAEKTAQPSPTGEEIKVKISLITPNRDQPRKNFDEEALAELAQSISRHGIIQPLIVRKKGKGYEIVAGERRYRAAQIAGLTEVPVIIKEYSEKEIGEIALIENIQREDLNPIEEAQAYDRLINEHGLTQEELAGRVSKSRSAITNHLRLLKLSDKVQTMVADGKLSEGHARTLVGLNATTQERMAELIIKGNLSVRDAEKLIKKTAQKKKPVKKADADELIYIELEEKLKQLLSTKVSIHRLSPERGRLTIEYYSVEELERLTDIFEKGR